LGIFTTQAQNLHEYVKGKLYTIDTIMVSGIKTFSDQTVISYSQLRKGQKINIPGDEISSIINKLWNLQLFSDINFYINEIEEDRVALEIEIEELPSLSEVKINGIKKGKIEPLLTETELKPEKNFRKVSWPIPKTTSSTNFKKKVFSILK
jgi:outer membrane protein insertion porin family